VQVDLAAQCSAPWGTHPLRQPVHDYVMGCLINPALRQPARGILDAGVAQSQTAPVLALLLYQADGVHPFRRAPVTFLAFGAHRFPPQRCPAAVEQLLSIPQRQFARRLLNHDPHPLTSRAAFLCRAHGKHFAAAPPISCKSCRQLNFPGKRCIVESGVFCGSPHAYPI